MNSRKASPRGGARETSTDSTKVEIKNKSKTMLYSKLVKQFNEGLMEIQVEPEAQTLTSEQAQLLLHLLGVVADKDTQEELLSLAAVGAGKGEK